MNRNLELKSNKTKVLLVVPTISTGGAEKLVYDIACYIDKSKYDVVVISLFSKTGNQKEKQLEEAGINVIYLNKTKGVSLKTFFDLKKIVDELKPNVIHSHLDVLIYLFPCYKRKQIKLHTVHSIASFEAQGIQKIIRIIAFKFFKVLPVAIGDSVQKSISSYYRINLKKIPCVYNGVMIPNEEKAKIIGQKITFVSVGTLYYVKNHKLLITAFEKCTKMTNKEIELNIIGDGELKEQLQEMITEFNLMEKVHLLGWKNDVYQYLKEADIYVCTSIVEGISLSIIEGMACGLPIIATNVGGNKDLVKHNFNGFLFESENLDSLTEQMLYLIENEDVRIIQARASKKISTQFSIEKCVREYEEIYG